MALLTINCNGKTWQDDLAPLVPQLDRIFGGYFKRQPDKDDLIAEAMAFFMVRFSRAWKPGETITLTTNFVIQDIMKGRRFVASNPTGGRAALRSVVAHSNNSERIGRIRRQTARKESWLDYRLLRDGIPAREATALRMAVEEGYTINEIARAVTMNWVRARSILIDALELLQD